jgi:hypothetical protein
MTRLHNSRSSSCTGLREAICPSRESPEGPDPARLAAFEERWTDQIFQHGTVGVVGQEMVVSGVLCLE